MSISKSKFLFSVLGLAAVSGALAIGILGQPHPAQAQAEGFSAAQKEEIGVIIKEYLAENPEIVMESLNKHREDMEQQQAVAATENLSKHKDFLTAADAPSAGNPKADVTIVEFFDYNCGYCKRAIPDVLKTLEADKNVRFVFHEMPILGPSSLTAAQWALAAHKQGKYFEYHRALMEHNGPKDDASLENIAKDLGLDVEKMKTDVKSDDVQKMISDSMSAARDLDINGTPAFIINDTITRGYMGPDGLDKAIAQEREKTKQQ